MSGKSDELRRIGVIARAHGIRGEVRVRTDEPASPALLSARQVHVRRDEKTETRDIASARAAGDAVLVMFEGIADRTEAEKLAGSEVLVPRSSLPKTEDGEFYAADLIGLVAVSPEGVALGKVVGLYDAGAVPVLEVEGERRYEVPLVEVFVKRIDLSAGQIVLEPPEEG